jgi:hypothetical protein
VAQVAIGQVCPQDGHTLLTYAGNYGDLELTANCFVCKKQFTSGNPEYVATKAAPAPAVVPTPDPVATTGSLPDIQVAEQEPVVGQETPDGE